MVQAVRICSVNRVINNTSRGISRGVLSREMGLAEKTSTGKDKKAPKLQLKALWFDINDLIKKRISRANENFWLIVISKSPITFTQQYFNSAL